MFKDIGILLLVDRKLYKPLISFARIGVFIALAWILYLPMQSQSNDIEENALNPDLLEETRSNAMSRETESLFNELKESGQVEEFIIQKMKDIGLETYQNNNIIGRFHTKRSHGYECNLFTFEYGKNKLRNCALMLSFMNMLKDPSINYLSRDILFVGYPSDSVEYGRGIVEFLEEYINPKGISKIPRCGVIREAINVNLDDNFNQVVLRIVGLNGRVPDRDFFININQLLLQTNIPFTYQYNENRVRFLYVQDALEQTIKNLWVMFDLNRVYRLPQTIFDFSSFFGMLQDSLEGDIHEPHSYLFKYGVHAVTIRGIENKQYRKNNSQFMTMTVSRVLEGANRAYMALDEHLHAGSTLYIPIYHKSSITITKYVWPGVIGAASMILIAFEQYFTLTSQPDAEKKQRTMRVIAMAYTKHIILELAGMISLASPHIARSISQDNFFKHYVIVVCSIYAIAMFVVVPIIRKHLFGYYRVDRTHENMISNYIIYMLHQSMGVIFCLILNIPTAYLIMVIFFPCNYFLQPIIPCFSIIIIINIPILNSKRKFSIEEYPMLHTQPVLRHRVHLPHLLVRSNFRTNEQVVAHRIQLLQHRNSPLHLPPYNRIYQSSKIG